MSAEPSAPAVGAAATEPDERLLERFVSARDTEAFALIVRRHGATVLHLCRRILGDGHDAEDAFQATFLVLTHRAGAVRRQDALASWLCGVATRVALRLKSRRDRGRSAERGASGDSSGPCDPSGDPAALAGRSDDEAVLAEELGQLPDKYRTPLVLCYLEGRTTEEAAARLHCPLGTFKSRLAKARDLMRQRLTRRGVVLTTALAIGLPIGGTAAAAVPSPPPRLRPGKLLLGVAAGLAVVVLMGVFGGGSPRPPAPAAVPQGAAPTAGRPGDTLVVANRKCGTVSLIDVRTGKSRATVDGGWCPREVAVSPGGTTAAVADSGPPFGPKPVNTLRFIDVAAGKVTRTLDLGRSTAPHGLRWLGEDRLLCVSETAGAVVEIDAARGEVIRALETDQGGSRVLAASADGHRAYAANAGSNTVTAFDLLAGRKLRDVPVGKGPEGVALSPDGRRLWVGGADGTVSVIDTADLRAVKTFSTRGAPHRLAFSPDGRSVAVTEPANGELAVYDAASLAEVKRIRLNRGEFRFGTPGPTGVAFAPDGKVAYCTVPVSNAVAVVDLGKGEVIGRWSAGASPDGIAFAPAGAADGPAAGAAEKDSSARLTRGTH